MVVYQREPHARQMAFADVQQPRTLDERVALARRALAEYELDVDVWIDDLCDRSRRAFGDLPHWTIVLRPDGRVAHKLPWTDLDELRQQIDNMLRWTGAQETAERGFLAAVTGDATEAPTDPAARHDRRAMLAWLVEHHRAHPERIRWLRELAADGPLRQRDWATSLLRVDEALRRSRQPHAVPQGAPTEHRTQETP